MKIIKALTISSLMALTACQSLKRESNNYTYPIATAISEADRTQADKDRDLKSHPDVVLNMLNIQPGDVVLDVFGGGGYYSELIARIVGENGKVYLHNNKAYINYVKKALDERMQRINYPQLKVHNYEVDDMNFPANQADAAMIIMSYHDLFYDDSKNGWPQIDLDNFMGQIHKSLKPKGRFLIVDHNAQPGHGADDSQSLHRLEKSYAIESIEAQGFKFLKESKIMANDTDDMTKSVFDPSIRGKTNRYILVFEKK